MELIDLLENQQILSLALKYATKLDKKRLAEKLDNLIINSQNNLGQVVNSVTSTPKNIIQPNKKFKLSTKLLAKSNSIYKTPTDSENEERSVTPRVVNSSVADLTINSQESLFSEEEPKNPFLKNLKQPNSSLDNPLSLTDQYAGFNLDKKDRKPVNEVSDKRKQPDTINDSDKQKEKQRKLDRFMFTMRK